MNIPVLNLSPLTIGFIFMVLKMTETVAWSWWWIASPLLVWFGVLGLLWIASTFYELFAGGESE